MQTARQPPWAIPPALASELQLAYATPPRAYHSWHHISEVLGWFDRVAEAELWRDPLPPFAAILFHDAIYVAGQPDNELRSAQLARRSLLQHAWPGSADQLNRVLELIELTAQHGKLGAADVDGDAALFLDCDTAILAASAPVFDAYDAAIADEYQHVPAAAYRAGRSYFLRGLLHRPRIFLSEFFHRELDSTARNNLTRILQRY